MTIFELVIDEDAEVFGVEAISLVEKPAIERDFVALKSDAPVMLADSEKRIVMGPALIPDKPIYRRQGDEEFYVYFSKRTIRRAMELYFKHQNQSNTTLEHDAPVKNTYLIESWIVESDQDKSRQYDMDVPRGTWMATMKIDNDAIWNDYVKTGKVKGFSIEGYFANALDLSAQVKDEVTMESYADYGDGVKNNAKKGIELNERNGNKCATQTGKVRAQQLANGEAISVETIRRMYSYLSRAETYYDPNKTTECGTISYLLWGGPAALGWSRNKLRELDMLEEIEELCKEYSSQTVTELNPIVP